MINSQMTGRDTGVAGAAGPRSGDFAYGGGATDAAGLRMSVSIFADRSYLRDDMLEDAIGAGFRISGAHGLDQLLDGAAAPLGDIVLVDCPRVDGQVLAGLARIDMRAAKSGAQMVVSTSVEALDDVFGAVDQSGAQILVAPSRAERVIALGHVLARVPGRKVRELSDDDRMVLMRLTHQVSQIAERMEKFNASGLSGQAMPALHGENPAFRFDAPRSAPADAIGAPAPRGEALITTGPELPDPRMVRRLIRQRQLRARFFDGDLFADPAWDMLLDLTAARAEKAKVSVTSLCIASGVPPTTALRWIGQMTQAGLLTRIEDKSDRRRAFVALTDRAAEGMSRYFAELGAQAVRGG